MVGPGNFRKVKKLGNTATIHNNSSTAESGHIQGNSSTTPTGNASETRNESQENGSNSSDRTNLSTTGAKKRGRGPTKGLKLHNTIKQSGKLKLVFPLGQSLPEINKKEFTSQVGVIVKANARMSGAKHWRDLDVAEQDYLYEMLKCWFDIEGWGTTHVNEVMYSHFQRQYTRWKNILHNKYKECVEIGMNPREATPREEITLENWRSFCDSIEDPKFQEVSKINSTNRSKLTYNHRSGSRSYLSRYEEMDNKSKIKLWADMHKKDGVFISSETEEKYGLMKQLLDKSEIEGESMTEEDIMEEVLGKRSGYVKGMGYGLIPTRGKRVHADNPNQDLRQQLADTQTELASIKEHSEKQKEEYSQQIAALNEKMKMIDERYELMMRTMSGNSQGL